MPKIPLPPRNTDRRGSYDDPPKGGTPDGKAAKSGATKLTWVAAGILAVVFVYAVVASL